MCCMVALNRCVSYSYDLVTLEIGGQDLKVGQAIDCAYVGSMRLVKCIQISKEVLLVLGRSYF